MGIQSLLFLQKRLSAFTSKLKLKIPAEDYLCGLSLFYGLLYLLSVREFKIKFEIRA